MNYKILLILFSFFLISCVQIPNELNKNEIKLEKKYSNSGFALIYDESLNKIKKLDDRSLRFALAVCTLKDKFKNEL